MSPSRQVSRGAILSSAMGVFSRLGIEATRVEDLLGAAGIARRTFYRYFASKEALVAALYEMATEQLVAAVERARASHAGDPLAGVRAGIDMFVDFHQTAPKAFGEVIELAMRSSSLLAPRRQWLREQIVRILDESVQALDGRRLDAYVYQALVSALEGLSLDLALAAVTPEDLERARSAAHALFDNALGLPDARPLPNRL